MKRFILAFLITIVLVGCTGFQEQAVSEITVTRSIQEECLDVARPGDVCRVMAGTYREALTIRRSGTASQPISLIADGVVTVNSGSDRSLVVKKNYGYYHIDGFRFVSSRSGSSDIDANVNFALDYWGDGHKQERGNDGFILRNCYVEGSVYFYGSDNLVENCEIDGKGRYQNGLIERSQPSEKNVFRNNKIHSFTVRGGWTLSQVENTLWEGNEIYDVEHGIDCDGAGEPVYDCRIINNHIHDVNSRGAEFENCFDCVFSNNHVDGAYYGFTVINYGPDVSSGGIEYRDDRINAVVENNIIENSHDGFVCWAAPGGVFRNNVLKNISTTSYWGAIGLADYGGFPCAGWEIMSNQFENSPRDWYIQNITGFTLEAQGNTYDSFGAVWSDRAINFTQWQALGFDIEQVPTPDTPTATSTATNTPKPPTATATVKPTLIPPTATNTPKPPTPTATEAPLTNTPVPPTYTPAPTYTAFPPLPTYTPYPSPAPTMSCYPLVDEQPWPLVCYP